MPWMVYFQQSAVVTRHLQTSKAMSEERTGTLLGSVLTQLIMIGALVTLAAAQSINKDGVGDKGCKVKGLEKAWGIPLMVIGSIWLYRWFCGLKMGSHGDFLLCALELLYITVTSLRSMLWLSCPGDVSSQIKGRMIQLVNGMHNQVW